MNLKVIKYKDYGWTMTGGEDDKDKIINRFYWSVYELNNGEIIVQQKIEDWEEEELIKTYYYYNYANCELKNGELVEYNFNQDFNTLFNSSPPFKDIKNPKWPTKEEESCVINFYNKKVFKIKNP
tara:strand:+ start:274 stop:648 length:375 start_codon:yes stop_codon:yes gene_type:complete